MVLLNLLASLSLVAAVGVPAVVSSQPEIEELSASIVNRKNSSGFTDGYVYYYLDFVYADDTPFVMFDGILPRVDFLSFDDLSTLSEGYGIYVINETDAFSIQLVFGGLPSSVDLTVFRVFLYDGSWHVADYVDHSSYNDFYGAMFSAFGSLVIQDSYRVIVSSDDLTLSFLPTYLE